MTLAKEINKKLDQILEIKKELTLMEEEVPADAVLTNKDTGDEMSLNDAVHVAYGVLRKVKDDLNDIYRRHYHEPKKTYLNALFFLLKDYCVVGVGISPKLMSFLTHKITRQLHLHWISLKIIKALFPFFRTLGRKIRKSTRMYKTGWDYITQNKEQLSN